MMLDSARAASLPADAVLDRVAGDALLGLEPHEALHRQGLHGLNELAAGAKEPLWKKLFEKTREPLMLLLLSSAAVSFMTGQIDDAVSILVTVVIAITIAIVQEHKSDQSLEALAKLTPPRCRVLRGGSVVEEAAADLVPGDVVLLTSGDRIPADMRLLEAVDLTVDESSLTGENDPSHKSTAALAPAVFREGAELPATSSPLRSAAAGGPSSVMPLAGGVAHHLAVAERRNCCFMGTLVSSGRGRAVVIATGMSTELGHVFSMLGKADLRKSPLQARMDELGQRLSLISFVIIVLIVAHGVSVRGKTLLEMFSIGVSLAVASIPEGLPIVVAVTLALGVQAVVKKLPSVEALGCASVICADKTGTLTQNEMTVVEAFSLVPPPLSSRGGGAATAPHDWLGSRFIFHGLGYDLTGGYATYSSAGAGQAHISVSGASHHGPEHVTVVSAPHVSLLAEVGAVCNNATLGPGGSTMIGQPTEGALLVAAAKLGLAGVIGVRDAWVRSEELSFSSDTKWMGVRAYSKAAAAAAAQAAATKQLPGAVLPPQQWYFVKGSVEAVLDLCTSAVASVGTPGGSPALAAALLGGGNVAAAPESRDGAGAAASLAPVAFVVAPLSADASRAVLAAAARMAREGLRVLALAKGLHLPGSNGGGGGVGSSGKGAGGSMVFVGLVGLHDPPRKGVVDAVRTLRTGGVRVCMITGDSRATAVAIATHLGLIDEASSAAEGPMTPGTAADAAIVGDSSILKEVRVDDLGFRSCALSGAEVGSLSDAELAARVASPELVVFYRTTPQHKMRICQAFQACGMSCAMTGDGVNDAPALKVADIGVAMGRGGTDVAKEAADMVLLDDNFATILAAIEEGKGIFYNLRCFVCFQLTTSIAVLSLVALSSLTGMPNPLNAMQILWINLIMDGPPAQSLGVEPVDHDIMRQPPRRPEEPIITLALMGRVLLAAFVICVGTLAVFFSEYDLGADEAAIRHDTTMTFTTFVMFAMFFAAACRSVTKSVFTLGFTGNPVFVLAVGGSIMCQVAAIYWPVLQAVFHTVPLSFADWGRVLAVSSTVLIVDELRKLFFCLSASNAVANATYARAAASKSDATNEGRRDTAWTLSVMSVTAPFRTLQKSGSASPAGFRLNAGADRGASAPGAVVRKVPGGRF